MTPSEDVSVLIVDDERKVADGYAMALEERYTVETAYDGEEGLERIDDDVDVVLLDRRMPGTSGEEFLARIRERGYDCPVAMVTAVVPDFDVVEMGFDDYLVKPVDIDDLFATVERLCVLGNQPPENREYIARTIKQASLEATKADRELQRSDRFQQLREALTDSGAELGDVSASMSDEEFELVLDTLVRTIDSD